MSILNPFLIQITLFFTWKCNVMEEQLKHQKYIRKAIKDDEEK